MAEAAQPLTDTICAIATHTGRSGIGVIRLSGSAVPKIAKSILGFEPQPRFAHFARFLDNNNETIDEGIALFFPSPHSFTGEDVLELQGHGGPIIQQSILQRLFQLGSRPARAGEFSERAFFNDKMDLVQAEAIADLIDAGTQQAARSAVRSMQGVFSEQVRKLVSQLIAVRVNVEAAIDFSDEDIDLLSDTGVSNQLAELEKSLHKTLQQARQGALLKQGIQVVIAGKPNAGKSSLLNVLSGEEAAIVTDVPGTTRDTISLQISVDGLPINLTDTAGLRNSADKVEQEGVRRAHLAISQADLILLVVDVMDFKPLLHSSGSNTAALSDELLAPVQEYSENDEQSILDRTLILFNKVDLLEEDITEASVPAVQYHQHSLPTLSVSATQNTGIDKLCEYMRVQSGLQCDEESLFSARERHILALQKASGLLQNASQMLESDQSLELAAEDLRLVQQELNLITGEFTSDDLLGEIFGSFCIGK